MKKIALLVFMVLIGSPIWALYCQNCSHSLPEDARFCPQCGTQRTVPAGDQTISPVQMPVLVPAEYSSAYTVESPFLQVNEHRIRRGQPIWILEAGEERVRIRFRHPTCHTDSITTWVSVGDLECHTGWRRHSREGYHHQTFDCSPSRGTTKIVFGNVGISWPKPGRNHHHGCRGNSHSDRWHH